ncbi:UNVERIFIED_CONTAM: hypothetical protein Slati_0506900 [Sesamum latifolium]|uniref:Uncharacterized protein n=1 Tax=Sesamum latifolium TaxID=2727402 RepID=A0AAW2XXP1_9LAMI
MAQRVLAKKPLTSNGPSLRFSSQDQPDVENGGPMAPIGSTLVSGPIKEFQPRFTNNHHVRGTSGLPRGTDHPSWKTTVKETSTHKRLEERAIEDKESSPSRMLILQSVSPEIGSGYALTLTTPSHPARKKRS